MEERKNGRGGMEEVTKETGDEGGGEPPVPSFSPLPSSLSSSPPLSPSFHVSHLTSHFFAIRVIFSIHSAAFFYPVSQLQPFLHCCFTVPELSVNRQ